MWAQSWGNLFEMLAPYPDATKVDLTQILKDKNFTTEKIFRVKENFVKFLYIILFDIIFISLNFQIDFGGLFHVNGTIRSKLILIKFVKIVQKLKAK
jgi:hypothetical protein